MPWESRHRGAAVRVTPRCRPLRSGCLRSPSSLRRVAPVPGRRFRRRCAATWRASDAWLLDRHGEPLSRVRIDRERRRGDWVGAERGVAGAGRRRARVRGPALPRACAASTGSRMAGAFRQTAAGERRGGSTLTMQLAAYLHPELESGGRRGLLDKWRQMRQALALERAWTQGPGARSVAESHAVPRRGRGRRRRRAGAARQARGRAGPRRERAARGARALAQRVAGPRRAPRLRPARARGAGVPAGAGRRRARVAPRAARAAQIEGDAPHLARTLLKRPGRARDEHARRPRPALRRRHAAAPPARARRPQRRGRRARRARQRDGRGARLGRLERRAVARFRGGRRHRAAASRARR